MFLGWLAHKCVYPDLDPELEKTLRELTKKKGDKLLKDTGNYLPEYIALIEKALGEKIPCHKFDWSSRNHHIARVRGAIHLAKTLADEIATRKLGEEDSLLLIGHSHGGQLFALLTNFLAHSPGVDEIISLAGEDVAEFEAELQKIRGVKLDIVTFATPPRYGWGETNYRLLNIINHRGKGHLGGNPFGLLTTKHGDYVQQWGIAGTDLIATNSKDKDLNRRLNFVLGEGHNVRVWLENAKKRMRVPNHGRTFLIDYKDNSILLPNCITTFFGHGVYTKFDAMLFNTQLVVEELYE